MNDRAKFWSRRAGGFFLTIIELCALGGLLGALIFPLAGRWGGSEKNYAELVVAGVKSGAFICMVWAPGVALVREFIRGAKDRDGAKAPPDTPAPAGDTR